MKRFISIALTILLVCMCITAGLIHASAWEKTNETRAIAIVFDNSGSMYANNGRPLKRWCQATYAMEVFASMLNKGDMLLIYPMWPIEVDGNEYTMENPLKITDSADSSKIREIYTPFPDTTPIESVDCAINGIKSVSSDKKYVIVLTDGETFNLNGATLFGDQTPQQLDMRIRDHAGPDLTMMYLGIGSKAAEPTVANSEFFTKMQADDNNSAEILSKLTQMCNQIFGRDTLPGTRIVGNTINFDISMSKLIVFVQGENISDLKLKAESEQILTPLEQTSTKHSTKGNGRRECPFLIDDSLQGMMVTYGTCSAGAYTLEYSGNATSVEVYYEPNADLDFVFSDPNGNTVDPESLYEGEYKVSFGMKDAETGKLIESDLLGNPSYRGNYRINDDSYPITHDGHSSFVPVALKMNDAFDANLTVTYLSGYTISKNSLDFGWPFGGIKVAARPAGDLVLEISGGDSKYSLEYLEEGTPYTAKVFYQGVQLTGEELEKVDLRWDPELSNAEITKDFAGDHYDLYLEHKNPEIPTDTACGKCTVFIYAYYTAPASDKAEAQAPISYDIEDDSPELQFNLFAESNYIVIGELDESKEIVAKLTFRGAPLSTRDFAATALTVDCGGINYEVTPCEQDSTYLIKLLPTEGIEEGSYLIKVSAAYTDNIGRTTTLDDSVSITLSTMPLWLKWVIGIIIFLIIALIILKYYMTPVLPNVITLNENSIRVNIDGEEQNVFSITVDYPKKGKRRMMTIEASGVLNGVYITAALVPAKDSYRYLPSSSRKALVVFDTVDASRAVKNITLGNVRFLRDENNNLISKPPQTDNFDFPMSRITFNGEKSINGRNTDFTVTGNIIFKSKNK